jgi:hypothetical protein
MKNLKLIEIKKIAKNLNIKIKNKDGETRNKTSLIRSIKRKIMRGGAQAEGGGGGGGGENGSATERRSIKFHTNDGNIIIKPNIIRLFQFLKTASNMNQNNNSEFTNVNLTNHNIIFRLKSMIKRSLELRMKKKILKEPNYHYKYQKMLLLVKINLLKHQYYIYNQQ